MRFTLDAEQRMFAEAVRHLLEDADTTTAARAWAAGDPEPGRRIWRALGTAGVFALAVEEHHGGAGLLPVELGAAMIEVGRNGVPGPVVESLAAARLLRDGEDPSAIAAGTLIATVALPPDVPYALDAEAADLVIAVSGSTVHRAEAREARRSLDPCRRLSTWAPADPLDGVRPVEVPVAGGLAGSGGGAPFAHAFPQAFDLGVLACAAQSIGVGMRLVDATVAHAKTREQFGRPIGEFQAVKHRLADALIEVEFARSLVYGAAVTFGDPDTGRDVSAAKVAAAEASYGAARAALQLHGAIGYTDEFDLSLWIRKARALYTAWGTTARHRARVMSAIV